MDETRRFVCLRRVHRNDRNAHLTHTCVMGVLGQRGSKQRPTYVGRSFLTRPTEWGIIASIWPRPRSRTTDRYQKSIQRNIITVSKHVARMNDREVAPLREALNQFNRTHKGMRGSASIRLEDLLTQLAMGRWFAFILPGGRIIYHRNALADASRRIDWLEPSVGSLLTRTDTAWFPTTPCVPGSKLLLMPSGPIPTCCQSAKPQPNHV